MSKKVTLLRSGNLLIVDTTSPVVCDLLIPSLSYVEKKYHHGAEAYRRSRSGVSPFEEIEWECFTRDHKNRLAVSLGFYERVKALLEANGYAVRCRWATDEEAQVHQQRLDTVYKPDWSRVEAFKKDTGFKYRYKQKTFLKLLEQFHYGRVDAPPGYGKADLIVLASMLYPRANIDVVVDSVAVLTQRLYPALCTCLPSVGVVGGGKKVKGCRVMCYSADSLHHGRADSDFVFVDEGHQACADKYAERLGMYKHARMWMFSASWDMRLDNKDMRAEAMAGPIRLKVTYQEAEARGIVVPIEVFWTDVIMDENPCSDASVLVEKKRRGIWTNEYRNKLIARDARMYDKDTQVLIVTETLQHALNLKLLLPEFKLMYGHQSMTELEIARLQQQYGEAFRIMTWERREKITKLFEKGKIKKVIATTVWNAGVNFRNLEVLIRADGGGSQINDTQLPGRVARVNDAMVKSFGTENKVVGIVRDYRDQFDSGFSRRASAREKSYLGNNWTQHHEVKENKSKLNQMVPMGNLFSG